MSRRRSCCSGSCVRCRPQIRLDRALRNLARTIDALEKAGIPVPGDTWAALFLPLRPLILGAQEARKR